MAGVTFTAADNGDFTMVNGHIVTPGTGVRHRHNDGATTTAETSSSTVPLLVAMDAVPQWWTQPSPECSPMVQQVLQGADYISQGST
eukprot:5193459-Amphidinium_carterae.1